MDNLEANHEFASVIERQFGVRVLTFGNFRPTCLPRYVSVHHFFDESRDPISNDTFFQIRDWSFPQGWDLSRQVVQKTAIHTFLYPVTTEAIDLGYHVTRTASLPSIRSTGLEPGTSDRCNDDRLDPLGSIYITTKLGQRGDAANDNCGTAHWWREHLAANNRFNDIDWSVLCLDFSGHSRVSVHQDIWSESGRIIRTSAALQCSIRAVG